MMTVFLVTGYGMTELGIFKDKDIRINIIKKVIKKDFIDFLENGANWFVFTGRLGFEYWALEVLKELQQDYDFKIATLFAFENHGNQWNAINQEKLQDFKKVDFLKYSFPSYENPQQLSQFNHFLLHHTKSAYLFYDEEKKSNLDYLYQLMKKEKNYTIHQITFERLNNIVEDLE
ncbi:SLOG family protein [Streptococcus marimammalium]|uniref:SLOG family protein n=1 Tax=Streptococcus marimammalium TaxID=269666 RepID=UPI00047739AA|nr:SLOG family protein [Streptococcus marimammalium]